MTTQALVTIGEDKDNRNGEHDLRKPSTPLAENKLEHTTNNVVGVKNNCVMLIPVSEEKLGFSSTFLTAFLYLRRL